MGPEYDEDAFFRSLLAMSEDQHNTQTHPQLHQPTFPFPQLPSFGPPPSTMPAQVPNQQMGNPLLSQTFLAWLQYMQLQMQLQQHQATQPQAQQPPPQAAPQQQNHVPFPMNMFALQAGQDAHDAYGNEPLSPLTPLTADQAGGSGSGAELTMNTPSPPPGTDGEGEPTVIVEEKRRRNTAASGELATFLDRRGRVLTDVARPTARFRVKKKQWTLNLERSITDLSGRVEELEREAAELRRENGWLKEIVMLKSKRFGGQGPAEQDAQLTPGAQAPASGAPPHNEEPASSNKPHTPHDENEGGRESSKSKSAKGKEVQR